MHVSQNKMESSYKNDPAYRVTTIVVPVFIVICILLFVWYSRDQVIIKEPRTITLYCFSAMENVMEKEIIPAFQQRWLKQHQERVEFISTFAGSGVITRQIVKRFPAEVAILSSELDARRLLSDGIIDVGSWQEIQEQEKFCQSPIILFSRNDSLPGNLDFEELDYSSLGVIIPDPLTSGEGQLAALAIYGSKLQGGASAAEAVNFVKPWFQGSLHQPSTSRDAVDQFLAGMGDVLIHFEAANFHNYQGTAVHRVYPKKTLMTEPVAVALKRNIGPNQVNLVNAFVEFLWSERTQKLLIEHGFQSQVYPDTQTSDPSKKSEVFTLEKLGNTADLLHNIVDPLIVR